MTVHPGGDRVRVPKAGELVASRLRRQIILGELREGDALPSESVLMDRFGVSRPTLREAFRILEAECLINIRRGARGGARVQVPVPAAAARYASTILQYQSTTLTDVYETRTLLESQAAGLLATRHRHAGDLTRLEELLAAEEAALTHPGTENFLAADEAFHLGVVELAGSRTLDLLVRMLYSIIETATASSTHAHLDQEEMQALRRRTHRSHARLLEVLREGEPAEVQSYWERHLTTISRFFLEDIPAETVLDLMT